MSLREQRNKSREAIIEGRFINHVLTHEAKELDADIKKRISGFDSPEWADYQFKAIENKLRYTHLKRHRYLDMKNRKSERGTRKKKFYNIHNRVLYGHANEIVKELTVGLTDGVREQMAQLGPID